MKIGIFDFDLEKDGNTIAKLFRSLLKKRRDKSNTFILFVDDEEFPVVENLHQSGWAVERVTDIKNIDDELVKRAHIVFIDNRGVGKILSENDAGIGLARLIKEAYGNKKWVILYSGHTVPVSKKLRVFDDYLEKDADTYQFELKIREGLNKIG